MVTQHQGFQNFKIPTLNSLSYTTKQQVAIEIGYTYHENRWTKHKE